MQLIGYFRSLGHMSKDPKQMTMIDVHKFIHAFRSMVLKGALCFDCRLQLFLQAILALHSHSLGEFRVQIT